MFFMLAQKTRWKNSLKWWGRVLGVTALGNSLESAITNAYAAAEKIS